MKKAPILLAMLIAAPAAAHHSTAMFDKTKEMPITGTVVQWQWTNPHSWLYVMVKGSKGESEKLGLELGSPNTLFRSGWRQDSFKPGDKVEVIINPRVDGTLGGMVVTARTPGGKWLEWLPRALRVGATQVAPK